MIWRGHSESLPALIAPVAFLFSGGALLAHIVVDLPLLATFIAFAGLAVSLLTWLSRSAGVSVAWVLRPGVVAGLCATVAYDLSRVLVVAVTNAPTSPIEAWKFFGAGLLAGSGSETLQWIIGGLFHLTNGVCFAIAFTLWLGRRGVVAGVLWGLFLEAFMLGLYPGWLGIEAYRPFLVVSLVGHVAYGLTLGLVCPRLLDRWSDRSSPVPVGSR